AASTPGGYHRYDWHLGRHAEWMTVPPSELLIVEGVGAGHPLLSRWRSVLVFVEAEPELRLRRGLDRDGRGMQARWQAWQAKEDAFFAAYGVRADADLVLRTDR
ncbi:MAG: 4-amino-4-deoxy-L-arabinose transferase, partial [Nocardioides sp.]